MPSKQQMKICIDKTWYWCKVILAIFILTLVSYWYGTYHPNKHAKSKVNAELDKYYVSQISEMGLQEPEFNFINDTQAALESGWGTSRFATEGNNLFGIRTWKENVEHLLPQGVKKWPGWGVKVFASKCDSVKYYIELLNNHSAYEKFRTLRQTTNDSTKLIKTLDKFSTTVDYDQRVIRMIKKIRKLEEKNAD